MCVVKVPWSICFRGFFLLGVPFQVGLSVASPRSAVGFTLQSLTLYVQMHEAPGSHPAEGYKKKSICTFKIRFYLKMLLPIFL